MAHILTILDINIRKTREIYNLLLKHLYKICYFTYKINDHYFLLRKEERLKIS